MSNKLFKIYKWITLALVICCAVALIIKCTWIYKSGDGFFADKIAASVVAISPILYLTVLAVIGGFIWSFFEVSNKKSTKIYPIYLLKALTSKYDVSSDELVNAQKKRKAVVSVLTAVIIILLLLPLFYLLNGNNFSVENINGDIINASVAVLLPCIPAFILGVILIYANEKYINKEIALIKAAVSCGTAKKNENSASNRKLGYLRAILIIIALVLITLGIFNDGVGDVYGKAVRICTECIGLG